MTTVEWVETTGASLEDAKDAALDQLGVADEDTEFEILEEPQKGLFGRTRGQARVRARIRPTQPRPKVERRDRRKKTKPDATSSATESAATTETVDTTSDAPTATSNPRRRSSSRSRPPAAAAAVAEASSSESTNQQGAPVSDTERDVDLDAHTAIVTEFVTGLVEAFGVDGRVESEALDDENVEVRVTGNDLGLLVGPKGATLAAVQELSRTVVHRQVPGTAAGRVRVDVAGYRQRRREALERFVQQVAEQVRESGVQKALEPMSPPDRKVVHDTVNEIDGVSTLSEGEEPRRRVVITPA